MLKYHIPVSVENWLERTSENRKPIKRVLVIYKEKLKEAYTIVRAVEMERSSQVLDAFQRKNQ